MMDYILSNIWQLWAAIAVLALILELSSGDFFIICFSIGALFAAIGSSLGLNFYWQIAIFTILSAVAVFTVRPVALRYLHRGEEQRTSNADALDGKIGTVSQAIPNGGFGRVAVGGDDWKARSADGEQIAVGTRVRIVSHESIIVTVKEV